MTQIQALESMSKEALLEHHQRTLQQHADDMDMLSKELASRTFVLPDGWQIAPKQATDDMQEAALFVNGSIGDRYAAMLAAAPTVPVDPYRVLMADQAELINIERLQRWLTKYGISAPESLEELGARRGHYVNALTRQEPFAPAAPVETQEPDQALLISMACCQHHGFGLLSKSQQDSMLQEMRKLWDEVMGHGYYSPSHRDRYTAMLAPVVKESLSPDMQCTCPSGDGSLRWPCPVHPPESEPKAQP